MSARSILFCREVPWETELPVSTRKLAERFADDGWQVIWLAPPLAPWPISKRLDQRLVEQHVSGGKWVRDGVFAYTPRTMVPFSLQLPAGREALASQTWRWCRPDVRSVLRRAGVAEPDALWISNLRGLGLADLFPGRPVLWQVTDDYPRLSRTPEACRDLCRLNFTQADATVFSSPQLAERTQRDFDLLPGRVHVLLHGVDEDRLAPAQGEDPLAGIEGPRIVYVGNTERADRDALRSLATRGVGAVVIIGNPEPFERDGERPEGLHLLGRKAPADVGRILPWCDVGVVSYGTSDLAAADAGGNPMKLYEYAAAGLPIVTPPLAILEELDAPVRHATSSDELAGVVSEVLHDRVSLGTAARAWAESHTWGARYEEADALVRSLCARTPRRDAPAGHSVSPGSVV